MGNPGNGTILLLEPGTGEVLSIPVNFVDFHNTEIAEFYKCVGDKVTRFLNGEDVLDNLEVSDMEVYWKIMEPLINL